MDQPKPSSDDKTTIDEPPVSEANENKLIRLIKSIVVNPEVGKQIDNNIVAFRYYNCFNYSLLSKDHKDVNLTLGITSPNPGEGKTLVASNLGVSLALGYQKKTVLVDLNVQRPRLHEIFSTALSPGLFESFKDGTIAVSRTAIEHLYILSAGTFLQSCKPAEGWSSDSDLSSQALREPPLGLVQIAAFRDVIYSLEQEFEFVIIDMPSVNSSGFPILFANQLNGLLIVVNVGNTKSDEIDRMFRMVNERQVLGFVFNRVKDENHLPVKLQ